MEVKPKYDGVTPRPVAGGYYDTIGFQLVALTGCRLDEAIAAYKMLLLLGSTRPKVVALGREIAELETAVGAGGLCNGWFVERGDGRLYVHHKIPCTCPYPGHGGRRRVRKYVGEAARGAVEAAIGRWQRLEAARVELVNAERDLELVGRLLGRWDE
jgi:hypothetical protein